MSQVSRQVGRPITKTATAQAKYATFEQNMKAATKAFRDFEKQCIEDGLLVRKNWRDLGQRTYALNLY